MLSRVSYSSCDIFNRQSFPRAISKDTDKDRRPWNLERVRGPNGHNEARTFLDRIAVARNPLAHANPISVRQAEQVICYSHDIIDSLKSYYVKRNVFMQYNVPRIIKAIDSFGNQIYPNSPSSKDGDGCIIWNLKQEQFYLRPGETIRIEIEVDPSFSFDDYNVSWYSYSAGGSNSMLYQENSNIFSLAIAESHVAETFIIECHVISTKPWHRCGGYDDKISVFYKVLPPCN